MRKIFTNEGRGNSEWGELVKQAVPIAIYKISLAMSGIYGYNHSWGVIFALLATLPPSAHHWHQYAEKEELNAFHKVFRFWCIQYCLSKGMSFGGNMRKERGECFRIQLFIEYR